MRSFNGGWLEKSAGGPRLEFRNGIGDEQMRGAAVGGFQDRRIALQLSQSVGQPLGIARQFHGGGISQVFALATDGKLNNLGQDRRDQRQHDRHNQHDQDDPAAAIAFAVLAATTAAA